MAEQGHDDAEATTGVRCIEHRWLERDERVSCPATSKTIEEMLVTAGHTALHADVTAVQVINRGATEVHKNPKAAATTGNGGLGQNESILIFGNKARLDLAQFISASGSVNVDVLEYIKKPAV